MATAEVATGRLGGVGGRAACSVSIRRSWARAVSEDLVGRRRWSRFLPGPGGPALGDRRFVADRVSGRAGPNGQSPPSAGLRSVGAGRGSGGEETPHDSAEDVFARTRPWRLQQRQPGAAFRPPGSVFPLRKAGSIQPMARRPGRSAFRVLSIVPGISIARIPGCRFATPLGSPT
jgi:hypothetical protein